jgi:rhodanese-related sulfurtransferase
MDYEITPEELKRKLDQGAAVTLLDVREPWEIETAHMEGAKLVPMGDIPSRAHQERLREQGFENAQSMRGGIDAWSRSVDATVPVY